MMSNDELSFSGRLLLVLYHMKITHFASKSDGKCAKMFFLSLFNELIVSIKLNRHDKHGIYFIEIFSKESAKNLEIEFFEFR